MRLDELLPSLRAGRRLRRISWEGKRWIAVNLDHHRIFPDKVPQITAYEFATERTWPGSDHRDSGDILADDWQIIAESAKEGYLPGDFDKAFNILTCDLAGTVYSSLKDWKSFARKSVESAMLALGANNRDEALPHLRAFVSDAMRALTAWIIEPNQNRF